MLQVQNIRQNTENIITRLAKRGLDSKTLIQKVLSLDEEKRQAQADYDKLATEMNLQSKQIGVLISQGKKEDAEVLKNKIAEIKNQQKKAQEILTSKEESLQALLITIPNAVQDAVPAGKSAEDNVIVKESGKIPVFNSNDLTHWDLANKYNLINFDAGTKITGSGFILYTGQGAKLERALINYFLDFNTKKGYKELVPPFLVNTASGFGTGNLPDKEGQMYHCTEDDLYLIPTSEVPVTNIHRDEIFKEEDLPIAYTSYSPCFRREAGSYGKDVKGLNRVHQFNKVEIVRFEKPEHSSDALQNMLTHVEELLISLELPYRILLLCGGDTGFSSSMTYDFEVYSKAQQKWLEVSSVSNFQAFQSNRAQIRYKNSEGQVALVHTLNGSSLALPRIFACLLENHQTENEIRIPKALQPYFGSESIN